MEFTGNTVLITGGASGIGLALAERLLHEKNEVIIVGRREDKLKEAKRKFPDLHTRVCDLSEEKYRIALMEWIKKEFPSMNILVNNAGIQQRANLLKSSNRWKDFQNEVSINLEAPIHLTTLALPYLEKLEQAAIINISSGLALTPGAWVPVYSATKAAMHSFTISLRLQLAAAQIEVIEILPPAINTDLGGKGLHTFGAPLEEFADSVFNRMKQGEQEIGYGASEKRRYASREELSEGTHQAWENFQKNNPDF